MPLKRYAIFAQRAANKFKYKFRRSPSPARGHKQIAVPNLPKLMNRYYTENASMYHTRVIMSLPPSKRLLMLHLLLRWSTAGRAFLCKTFEKINWLE